MIGKLYGTVDEIEKDYIILNTNNVGYIIYVTGKILRDCKIGDNLTLFIETYEREGQTKLYGFVSKQEIAIVRMLIKVNGVSHKIATNIVGTIPIDQIIRGIVSKNPALLKASGVGVKLANRIISELENVIKNHCVEEANPLVCDAISALINLGYDANGSYKVVNRIMSLYPEINNINKLVRLALKDI